PRSCSVSRTITELTFPLLRALPSLTLFFNHTAPTETSTLSLHDALPISRLHDHRRRRGEAARARDLHRSLAGRERDDHAVLVHADRKSTRLNSSHLGISYAVFCLKKKNIPI